MWEVVRRLREDGVTIILTTHYIEEAEEMADRIGVINHGKVVLVEEKAALIQKLGRKQLTLQLHTPLAQVPELLAPFSLALADEGATLVYTYDSTAREEGEHGIAALLSTLKTANIRVKDLSTRQSSLEDIFVDLIKEGA